MRNSPLPYHIRKHLGPKESRINVSTCDDFITQSVTRINSYSYIIIIAVKMLNPKKSLKDQGIYKADTLTVTLRKRLFFPETTNYGESCDEKEPNRTYLQLQNAVITRVYSCTMSCDIAVKLAALQYCRR